MNKFIIPLLTFGVILVTQESARTTDDPIKNDTSTGPPQKQQVPESAKDELLRLLRLPIDLEKDQEPINQRIQQLREHITKQLPGIPPRIPLSQVSDFDVIQVAEAAKGIDNIDEEKLTNLALRRRRLNPGETSRDQIRGNMTPSEIGRAVRAITDVEDPNALKDDIEVKD